MDKKKVLVVFGTRPEAIKMAPVIKQLKNQSNLECEICITAQHRDLLDQVLNIFNIKPDYDLNVMKKTQSLSDITSNVLIALDQVIKKSKPDLVLVHGDTSTTFSAALTAFYNGIKIGHVEAGLRTYDKFSPFPEEMNRRIVGLLADYHFAPTELSKINLLKEGILEEKIVVTGNTAIDALFTTVSVDFHHEIVDWLGDDKLILLTSHRRENQGEPMMNIFHAVKKIADKYKNIKIVFPVHPNPKIKELANSILDNHSRIKLIEPLGVTDFHNLIAKAYIILTDSGGIQEEAPALNIPVLVLRDTTERPEGVIAGTLRLIGTDIDNICKNVDELINDDTAYKSMSNSKNPYGDGSASEKIVDYINKIIFRKE